jgi:ribosome-associated protein
MSDSPEHLIVNDVISIPDSEFEWTYARSGGPGGQNVNKVSSKAVLRWKLTESPSVPPHVKERFLRLFASRVTTEGEVVISSQQFRDQERNRQDCREKLAEMLREAATLPKPRKATKPTKGSKRRRLADKKRNAETKAGRKSPGAEE